MHHLLSSRSILQRSLLGAIRGSGLTAVVAVVLAFTLSTASAASAPQHDWKRITYEPIPVPWSVDGKAYVSLQPDAEGLRLDLMMATEDMEAGQPAKGKVRARLHRKSSSTPFADLKFAAGTTRSGHVQWHYLRIFPWGADRLTDTWLEFDADGRTFWLEIPYGLDREPGPASADPADLAGVPAGAPKLAASMAKLAENALIVPWHHVRYELGPIENDWHLTVLQSNAHEPTAEVELYRDDTEVGRSMFLWGLHEPRTAITVAPDGERLIGARCMELRLHSDGMRRSDTFVLSRDSSDKRGWGTMKIAVGKHLHELVLPSSLYRHQHGVAEPHHPARLR